VIVPPDHDRSDEQREAHVESFTQQRRRLVEPLPEPEHRALRSDEHERLIHEGIDPPLIHYDTTTEPEAPPGDVVVDEAAAGKASKRGPSQSSQLVKLAIERYQLAVTPSGLPFAVERDGPNVARMLRGGQRSLRSELARLHHKTYKQVPSASALTDAMLALEGYAADTTLDVHLRVARDDDVIVYDLGDESGEAVVVTPEGWTHVGRSTVLFRRTALTASSPAPQRGGHFNDLYPLVNVNDDTRAVAAAWCVAALLPELPHPIFAPLGEQGTAKSTTTEVLANLIDPSTAQLRSVPHNAEQWATVAAGSWVVALDNVSYIAPWLSDMLCRAVTGTGYPKRALYTNDDLHVVSFKRVVLLNGIDVGALQGDLAERTIAFTPDRIPDESRRTDEWLRSEWARVRAHVLGSLFDLASAVLRELPGVQLAELPRMADFARVLAAADKVNRTDARTAYVEMTTQLDFDVVDADVVGQVLRAFVVAAGKWSGTASELLAKLPSPEPTPKAWPTSASALGGKLKRLAPALRRTGIEVEFDRASGRRIVTLAVHDAIAPSSPSSPSRAAQELAGGVTAGDAVTAGDGTDGRFDLPTADISTLVDQLGATVVDEREMPS
jgi:hypothetical protein